MAIYTDILKELRRQQSLRQEDIADKLNMSRTMYSYYESGKRELKIQILCALADKLNTSTDYILGRTDTEIPYPKRHQRK